MTYPILDDNRRIRKLDDGTIVVPITPQMA